MKVIYFLFFRNEDMIDYRSYVRNLSSYEIKAWKKFRPERDSNPLETLQKNPMSPLMNSTKGL